MALKDWLNLLQKPQSIATGAATGALNMALPVRAQRETEGEKIERALAALKAAGEDTTQFEHLRTVGGQSQNPLAGALAGAKGSFSPASAIREFTGAPTPQSNGAKVSDLVLDVGLDPLSLLGGVASGAAKAGKLGKAGKVVEGATTFGKVSSEAGKAGKLGKAARLYYQGLLATGDPMAALPAASLLGVGENTLAKFAPAAARRLTSKNGVNVADVPVDVDAVIPEEAVAEVAETFTFKPNKAGTLFNTRPYTVKVPKAAPTVDVDVPAKVPDTLELPFGEPQPVVPGEAPKIATEAIKRRASKTTKKAEVAETDTDTAVTRKLSKTKAKPEPETTAVEAEAPQADFMSLLRDMNAKQRAMRDFIAANPGDPRAIAMQAELDSMAGDTEKLIDLLSGTKKTKAGVVDTTKPKIKAAPKEAPKAEVEAKPEVKTKATKPKAEVKPKVETAGQVQAVIDLAHKARAPETVIRKYLQIGSYQGKKFTPEDIKELELELDALG